MEFDGRMGPVGWRLGTWDTGNGIDALGSATYKVPCIPLRCMIF